MRIVSLILLGALTLSLGSCKKNEDSPAPTGNNNTGGNNTGGNNTGGGGTNGTNVAPTVSITSPADGASVTLTAGGGGGGGIGPKRTAAPVPSYNLTISASAADSDGTISKVEFYNGTTLLGTDTEAPYSYNGDFFGGTYSFTAKAFDDDNASTVSEAVDFTVEVLVID
jgi:hypothetical protein